MGKGNSKSNPAKGKKPKKAKSHEKKGSRLIKKVSKLIGSRNIQRLVLASLLEQKSSSSESSSSGSESDREAAPGALDSPLLDFTDMEVSDVESGERHVKVPEECTASSPTTPPHPSTPSPPPPPIKEGQWHVESHDDGGKADAAAAAESGEEDVIDLYPSDDDIIELLGQSAPSSPRPPTPLPVPPPAAADQLPLADAAADQPPEPAPNFIPDLPYLSTDHTGTTRLAFQRNANPFMVKSHMVRRGLHKEVHWDKEIISFASRKISACLPYQNGTCREIIPIHPSPSSSQMFQHVCLLCLLRGNLPFPHPLLHCPFAEVSD